MALYRNSLNYLIRIGADAKTFNFPPGVITEVDDHVRFELPTGLARVRLKKTPRKVATVTKKQDED
jgi:hypothetical protein